MREAVTGQPDFMRLGLARESCNRSPLERLPVQIPQEAPPLRMLRSAVRSGSEVVLRGRMPAQLFRCLMVCSYLFSLLLVFVFVCLFSLKAKNPPPFTSSGFSRKSGSKLYFFLLPPPGPLFQTTECLAAQHTQARDVPCMACVLFLRAAVKDCFIYVRLFTKSPGLRQETPEKSSIQDKLLLHHSAQLGFH